jgi:hypothetical protein
MRGATRTRHTAACRAQAFCTQDVDVRTSASGPGVRAPDFASIRFGRRGSRCRRDLGGLSPPLRGPRDGEGTSTTLRRTRWRGRRVERDLVVGTVRGRRRGGGAGVQNGGVRAPARVNVAEAQRTCPNGVKRCLAPERRCDLCGFVRDPGRAVPWWPPRSGHRRGVMGVTAPPRVGVEAPSASPCVTRCPCRGEWARGSHRVHEGGPWTQPSKRTDVTDVSGFRNLRGLTARSLIRAATRRDDARSGVLDAVSRIAIIARLAGLRSRG